MKTQLLKGSKQEIVDSISRIHGEVREAIVFIEESASLPPDETIRPGEDIFDEMHPFMSDAKVVDDSRESIYSRMESE